MGTATILVIQKSYVKNKLVYHLGDTGICADMEIVGRFNDIDLALVPIGGNFTMDVKDAIDSMELIKPKMAIPMHFNTFPVIEQATVEFLNKLPKNIQGIILTIGEEISL